MAKPSKKPADKLKALIKTQEINEMLSKSITESEALQNSGDDRPEYEAHVTDLLDRKSVKSAKSPPKKKAKLGITKFFERKKR